MTISINVISTDPLIIHGYNYSNVLSPAKELSPYLRKHKVTFLISVAWSLLVHNRLERASRLYRKHKRKYPQHEIYILANDQKEYDGLRALGVPTVFCNHNAFLDEREYTVVPGEKKYNGVINSRMKPYKRIELAKDTKDLCIIASDTRLYPGYTNFLLNSMPYMDFVQFENKEFKRGLNNQEIRELYGKCRSGLILSAEEGACFAAGEYLLCGLPVVTTHNLGGRDTFYHEDYAVWCDDTPQGVKEAVDKVIALPISAEEIRERTIKQMQEHRANYIAVLNEIAGKAGKDIDFASKWNEIYVNKMLYWYGSDKEALEYLRAMGITLSISFYRTFRRYHEAVKGKYKSLKLKLRQ